MEAGDARARIEPSPFRSPRKEAACRGSVLFGLNESPDAPRRLAKFWNAIKILEGERFDTP